MATIVLSAVGAAAGASIGGGVLGLSSVVIGRAVGATIGRAIDQRILGGGSEAVETGRVDRFRLTGASEGAAIVQVYGRMRVAGQVIWATQFQEKSTTTGGGKGAPSQPEITQYSYTVSMAIALCEGEITRVGRVWADGKEVARDDLSMQVYLGSENQLPDPKMEAVEGVGNVPGYRGLAYVVFAELSLGAFGNRVPQFSFEVKRPAQDDGTLPTDPAHGVKGVALIPGTGEYSLATEPVYLEHAPANTVVANVHSPSGKTDFLTSIEALNEELPNCTAASLIVSWFGDDLRCDRATIRPKVEQTTVDGKGMPWGVSGQTRSAAQVVPLVDGRPVYGGTPTDQSVVQAIGEMNSRGIAATFYPFILMDQIEGNGLADPWSGTSDQPKLPWRGRMTLSVAPGQSGSPDQTAAADAEVSAFFGTVDSSDFDLDGTEVTYSGPAEWSYRRFILHNAWLCKAAGGVEAFCIGSEMRGMTQIRGAGNTFPAVAALRTLAADVNSILGTGAKVGYAADWSEYFGYHPQDGSGDVFFNLDPLWADTNIDFVGIDNYMPLSDWRDGNGHADADWGSIYNVEYLKSNIAGGEGFDWYYAHSVADTNQDRSSIQDGAYGEDWVFRYKDLKGWWNNPHHNRLGGVRNANATAWLPQSKPFRFTEFGCAAINKGTNQPNKFLDLKSSESSLPKYSDGRRDELIQMQYLRAMFEFWRDAANNPVSAEYSEPMVDMDKSLVWAWDTRPFPHFPMNDALWSDAPNYFRGHWLNGRTASRSLADVVAEICTRSGVTDIDVSVLYGYLRGYTVSDIDSARAALQPLMIAYGFEVSERDGMLVFKNRDGRKDAPLTLDDFALEDGQENSVEKSRLPEVETVGRIRLNFVDADADYEVRAEEAIFPDEMTRSVGQSDIPLVLTQNEGRATVERWLSEARVSRETKRFALPLSNLSIGAGDVLEFDEGVNKARYRVDRVTQNTLRQIEAVRVEPEVYEWSDAVDNAPALRQFEAVVPVFPVFMDLPLLRGDEVEHAPHLAVASRKWPGAVAVFGSPDDNSYSLISTISSAAAIGVTETLLAPAMPGTFDRSMALRVRMSTGTLASVTADALLNGANVAAIGSGTGEWEVLQFGEAVLVEEDVYDISFRLRGQAGSDGLAKLSWPPGSLFVILDDRVGQINHPVSARGLERHYRIGPAQRPVDDPSFVHLSEAFDGNGLRPYAPVHLRTANDGTGGTEVSWIRRTRIDGDSWQSFEVPLGEEAELYQIRVFMSATLLREETTISPSWTYTAGMKAVDSLSGAYRVEVAQISNRFGAGLSRRIDLYE